MRGYAVISGEHSKISIEVKLFDGLKDGVKNRLQLIFIVYKNGKVKISETVKVNLFLLFDQVEMVNLF